MPDFEVVGSVDPFLLVRLKKGEQIYCESNAMVSMEAALELKGEMRGGMLRALTRRFTAGESFFQQQIAASHGDGETLLAPNMPGDIMVLDVGARQYRLNDGAFLAADIGVSIETHRQGIGQALFGGTGGFFIMETKGSGKLAISGFGAIFNLDVAPGADVIVDNQHVVAWDASLTYKMTTSTAKSGGIVSGMIGSMKSGEGIVQRFSGTGKVAVCSRNRASFVEWLASRLGGGR